jgi:hypothetical protein
MADQRLKDLRGPGRRNFLKWVATAGAALGLERARFLDALSGVGGSALADQAACNLTNKSISINAANGSLSWYTLLFPTIMQATVNNGSYAFYEVGKGTMVKGTDQPWARGTNSPFATLPANRQMTGFVAGNNSGHTNTPALPIATGVSMVATLAAIQQATPTLLPVIAINPTVYGTSPGAPAIATVGNSAGLVGLFDSVASKTLLSTPSNAALHEAYYKAFLGLNAAAGRPSVAKGYETGKIAANLLGKNLATQLAPTAADDAAFGITSSTSTALKEHAHTLITALKAFKLGLTSMVNMSPFLDDPHGAFGGGDQGPADMAAAIGKQFDAFMAQAAATPDPGCSSKSLADNIVFTITGDLPKDPYQRSGWPDGTMANANFLYVYGAGYLKTGWFGSYDDGKVSTFDPATGANVAVSNTVTTASMGPTAAAAAAYAVAKGDLRRVQDFYRGPAFPALVNTIVT